MVMTMTNDAKAHDTKSNREAETLNTGALMLDGRLASDDLKNFDKAFSLVAFTMNRFIVDHLLRFARQFGPDYQMLVVWTVLAHQSVVHLIPLGRRPQDVLSQEGRLADPDPEFRSVRQRDLSQITGIPKETVRRKLLKLEQNGWILRKGPGWVLANESIDPELREFSRETAKRMLSAADHMRTLMRQAGDSQ
jgi:predicted transcriptional regulator